jgi:hypothetical protein
MFAEENAKLEGIKPGKNVAWAIGNAQSPASEWAGQAIQLEDAHRLSKGAGVRVAGRFVVAVLEQQQQRDLVVQLANLGAAAAGVAAAA